MNDEDRRLTLEGEILRVVSSYGGERIIAGPPMDRMLRELADLFDGRDDLRPDPSIHPSTGRIRADSGGPSRT